VRILHTSDWHLGRSFHREDLLGHQGAFVDHLLEVVEQEEVDVVVVAGDVYDRALPHVDAVALADEAFARLAASRAQVVVSSGNHDSPRRLGFGSRLMDAAGVFVRTDASSVGTPVVIPDRHGDVAIHAIPYLDPSALLEPWALGRRSHEAAIAEAMGRVRADLTARGGSARSVVLAHAFVAGATPSESERDISVGGVSRVATSLFDGIDYTALGHLHGPHVLDERLRYSGSPLAYSFSEAEQVKGSWLVDLDAAGFASATWVEAPVPRRLARLSGTLEELLADPTLSAHEDDWVQVTLTDARRPLRAMELLRRRFPHTLVLQFPTPTVDTHTAPRPAPGTSDHDIALDFVRHVRGSDATPGEAALLREAIDACCHDPDLDVLVDASVGPGSRPGGTGGPA
jgi:exonuclease SbcD